MYYFYLTRKGPYKDHLIVKDEFMDTVFESNTVSSYPDYPQGVGIFNDKMPDATVRNGKYLLKGKLQERLYGNDWWVLEIVNMDGSQNVPCWRCVDGKLVESTTAGANIHWRPDDLLHLDYAKSTACFTDFLDKFKDMRKAIGMSISKKDDGKVFGVLFVEGKPEFPDPLEGAEW